MRIAAFSCVHWMSRDIQVRAYGYEHLNYAPFIALCREFLSNPPDIIVNLGDFTEPMYEDHPPEFPAAYQELVVSGIEIIKLAGNHDRALGSQFVEMDGVRFEHGHKLSRAGQDASVNGYITQLREDTRGLVAVHGHSHVPFHGVNGWPLDVGSVTFSRTYGEVVDGQARLLSIPC